MNDLAGDLVFMRLPSYQQSKHSSLSATTGDLAPDPEMVAKLSAAHDRLMTKRSQQAKGNGKEAKQSKGGKQHTMSNDMTNVSIKLMPGMLRPIVTRHADLPNVSHETGVPLPCCRPAPRARRTAGDLATDPEMVAKLSAAHDRLMTKRSQQAKGNGKEAKQSKGGKATHHE